METATSSPKRQYDFSVQVPIRRPRAWERAPQTSFAPRHRGRKVWKRYELRSKEETVDSSREDVEQNDEVGGRPVKRLRNAQGDATGREGADDGMDVGYIPTLRSEAPGTPRSMSGSQRLLGNSLSVDHVVFSREIREAKESQTGSIQKSSRQSSEFAEES